MKFVLITCFVVGVAFSNSLFADETQDVESERLLQDEENAGADVSFTMKRGILQLADMVRCTTHRTLLAYLKYGCWCGPGGKGTPVDDTDRCCKIHDECYRGLTSNNTCSKFELRFKNYQYTTSDCGNPNVTISCHGGNGTCAKEACECDRAGALCLRNATYNKSFYYCEKWMCN